MTGLVQTLVVIAVAELGDKSQLVCLALASRFPPWQVWMGAVLAFAVLDGLAVAVGAAVATFVGPGLLSGLAAAAFAFFGVLALVRPVEEEDEEEIVASGHSGIWVAALALGAAELGDKTQLVVTTFASVYPAWSVWLGATLALAGTSALAVLAGRALLSRMPRGVVQRVGGVLFLLAAVSLLLARG